MSLTFVVYGLKLYQLQFSWFSFCSLLFLLTLVYGDLFPQIFYNFVLCPQLAFLLATSKCGSHSVLMAQLMVPQSSASSVNVHLNCYDRTMATHLHRRHFPHLWLRSGQINLHLGNIFFFSHFHYLSFYCVVLSRSQLYPELSKMQFSFLIF